jgi:polyhydroxyalkanoate synthase
VYKIHLLTDTDVTFCLCTGGHNVGVVNPPGPGVKRSFQLVRHAHGERYVDPDTWTEKAAVTDGSWWPAWQEWLAAHSGRRVAPPPMGIGAHDGEALDDAPGRYVLAA